MNTTVALLTLMPKNRGGSMKEQSIIQLKQPTTRSFEEAIFNQLDLI